MLKKKLGNAILTIKDLPTNNECDSMLKLELILDSRWIKKRSTFEEESLIKLKNLSEEDATQKNTAELQ